MAVETKDEFPRSPQRRGGDDWRGGRGRAQAAMWLWSQMQGSKRGPAERRAEATRLGAGEAAVAKLAAGQAVNLAPAAGVLNCLLPDSPANREMVAKRGSSMMALLFEGLSGSPSYAAQCLRTASPRVPVHGPLCDE